MDEREIRSLIDDVMSGRVSRRRFVQTMVGLGLTAPFAAQLLTASGVAAQPKAPAFTPTRRGGGGPLKVLWWQAPTLLNPHFSTGTKDQDGSRIFYEPLAAYDPDGNLSPVLAATIPSVDNGGLSKDGTWVLWNLKKGVQWHDGKPLTADDVIFNWEYAADPATAAVTIGAYRDIARVERVNDHAVKVVFKQPTPFWFEAFCGQNRALIPKHLFDAYRGAKSREAPNNLKPVGTGPYRFVDFKPGDIVRGELNPSYHMPNRPFFDTLEMKGSTTSAGTCRWRTTSSSAWSRAARAAPRSSPPATSSTSSSTPPIRGRTSTGSARASRPPIRRCRIRPCARR
jgi:peptide/nickel transport system substrate-binding protein